MKSGNATDNIIDNSGIVSGLIGCPLIDCSMMDKDLLGGLPLIEIENIETWHHCGNFRIGLLALKVCFRVEHTEQKGIFPI